MVEKIWLNSYPKGVAPTICVDPSVSLVDMFKSSVKKFGARPVLSSMGCEITYRELDQRSDHFAAYLQNTLQLKKGDRFAIMLPNLIQYVVSVYAALKLGLVVVNVNPLYTAREVVHQLKDAGAEAIIVLANFAHTLEKGIGKLPALKHIIITEVGDAFPAIKACLTNFVVRRVKRLVPVYHLKNVLKYRDVLAKGKKQSLEPVVLSGSDVAFLQYTGGTTGVAKGAILTHTNLVANVEQAYLWNGHFLHPGKEVAVAALPLYHIFSLMVSCFFFIKTGALNILIANPRDFDGFAKTLSRYQFSAIIGVNTLFNALVHNVNFRKLDFSKVRFVMAGGMALQHAVAQKWQQLTGVNIVEAYGLTETSPAAVVNPVYSRRYNGSIGLPLPSTNVKLIDDEGKEVALGSPGELCVQGPQVMQSYWNLPDETANVLDDEGWLKTGDVARMDERGFLYIIDRKKDMVVVSGFNVYPNEVEAILSEHPDIAEVAVVGVPYEKTGEALKAYIVTEKHRTLLPKDLIAFCRHHLTGYKVPKQYQFCGALPKSNVGKILRRELRDNPDCCKPQPKKGVLHG
jgi:long-chain acyl-CoA synthetase